MTKPIYVKDTSFENEVLNSDTPILVDFYADWCAPCRAIAPMLDELADEVNGAFQIAKVDIDSNTATAATYQIESIPTLILFKNGQAVEQWNVVTPKDQLLKEVGKHLIN
jgi:thioredoxin 1